MENNIWLLIEKDNKSYINHTGKRNLCVVSGKAACVQLVRGANGEPVVTFLAPLSEYNPKLLAVKKTAFTEEDFEKFGNDNYTPKLDFESVENVWDNFISEADNQLDEQSEVSEAGELRVKRKYTKRERPADASGGIEFGIKID